MAKMLVLKLGVVRAANSSSAYVGLSRYFSPKSQFG